MLAIIPTTATTVFNLTTSASSCSWRYSPKLRVHYGLFRVCAEQPTVLLIGGPRQRVEIGTVAGGIQLRELLPGIVAARGVTETPTPTQEQVRV